MADSKVSSNIQSNIERLPDTTIKLTITVPWKEVSEARENVVLELVKNVSVPGFRKGSAPRHLAEEKLDKQKVDEETLKKVLPVSYIEAVKRHNLKPIVNPKIHVEAFALGTDLKFMAETYEEPEVKLNNYKEQIRKVTAASKILVPGKEPQKPKIDDIAEVLLKYSDIKISKLLSESEVNRLLAQLIDELKTLGMSLEQYLTSKGKTGEQLRSDYELKAINDLKLEFVLRKIADEEKISVDQKDIDEVLAKIQDEKQKAELTKNTYLLSSIIRQQKTLDFLTKL